MLNVDLLMFVIGNGVFTDIAKGQKVFSTAACTYVFWKTDIYVLINLTRKRNVHICYYKSAHMLL